MTSDAVADEPAEDAVESVASTLLALQRVDTDADQLRVRRERLAERDDVATRTAQMTEWERRRAQVTARIAELGETIERSEATGAELSATRERLQAQLKTVIAPREAEALMHEITTVDGERDALDDVELAALEEQATLDDELTAHLGGEEALRSALRRSDDALAAACHDIDVELAALAEQRSAVSERLDAGVLSRYESVRSSVGVAVSELNGSQCTGCHLALSAAEVDDVKADAAASGYCDCPQCGRMLVV